MSPPGEWQTRFDPHFSSRGVFYLDNKRMVDVEVMEDTKYPLSVFIDRSPGTVHSAQPRWPRLASNRHTRLIGRVVGDAPEMGPGGADMMPSGEVD